jgi:hypothetical protein
VKVEEEPHWAVPTLSSPPPLVNDTKNIPKNFGKAIITFIQKHPSIASRCLQNHKVELNDLLRSLKLKKKTLHSIK